MNTQSKSATIKNMDARFAGYCLALAQAVLYATSGVLTKVAYGMGMGAAHVVDLRFFGTLALVATILVATRKHRILSRQPLVYIQGLLFAVGNILFMFAVDALSAGLATVIFFAGPALVALMAVPVYREKLTGRTVCAIILALTGILLVSGLISNGTGALSPIGLVYALGGMVAMALYGLLGQKTTDKDHPLTITATVALVSSILATIAFPASIVELGSLDTAQWGIGVAIALFCATLPVICQLGAIARIGATKASFVGTLETPFSLLFAFIVLGETLTTGQMAGSVLIIASVLALTVPSRRTAKGKLEMLEA